MRAVIKSLIRQIALSLTIRERTFGSFREAQRRSPMRYDAEILGRFRVERAKLNMHAVSSDLLPPAYSFLLLAVHMSRAEKPHVVDFGGACGEWAYALRGDSKKEFSYTIVENPDLVKRCSSDPFFRWARWAQELPQTFDIFASSGTLNFVENPYDVLEFALANAKEYVVLGRNSFCETDIFRVHESLLTSNGFGSFIPDDYRRNDTVHYPHGTLSLRKILCLASSAGWSLKLQADSPSGVLPFKGMVFGRDLLFARTPSVTPNDLFPSK